MDKSILRAMSLAAACAMCQSSARADETATSFSFEDVHFWVGSGTNRAVVVVDFNLPDKSSSLAWGYRWNGDAVQKDALDAIAREDRRYHVGFGGDAESGVAACGYDANGNGGFFKMPEGVASDADDFVGGTAATYFEWAKTELPATTFYHIAETEELPEGYVDWRPSDGSVNATRLAPNSFVALKHMQWGDGQSIFVLEPYAALPIAAESPYAFRVVDIYTGGRTYNNPDVVIGRPAYKDCIYDFDEYWNATPTDVTIPITPCVPTWTDNNEIIQLSDYDEDEDATYVVVEFDHAVVDDPLNPWGLDFIVFGNAFMDFGWDYYLGTENPAVGIAQKMTKDGSGRVKVSQDGVNWFCYEDGPFDASFVPPFEYETRLAGGFAPTMGYVYDSANADTNLFAGNQWWSVPTDATYPVDPRISASDLIGKTLTETAIYYNGSAGGIGYDIGRFALLVDEKTGRKWIKYVKVENIGSDEETYEETGDVTCVIDAFADVSPDMPYDYWAKQYFSWQALSDTNIAGKTVVSDNGKPNFYNAALGANPEKPALTFGVSEIVVENGQLSVSFPRAEYAHDVKFLLTKTMNLASNVWADDDSVVTDFVKDADGNPIGKITIPVSDDSAFFKVGIGIHE